MQILVIGAGVVGLAVARAAALKGHDVVVAEAESAIGTITHLTGRVLGPNGSPIKDATVEIWQCDAKQVYLHSADSDRKSEQRDKNFPRG